MNMRHNPRGRLTVDTALTDGKRWGRLRDGLRVAVPYTVRFEPDPAKGPTIEVGVDEHSGALVITSVSLSAPPGAPITTDSVRVYSLTKLVALGAQRAAMPAKGWDAFEEGEVWPPSNQAVMESIVAATRARVSVDRGRLDDVADAYDRGGVGAVEAVLKVSRSQAYRLVRLARERGLIEAVR